MHMLRARSSTQRLEIASFTGQLLCFLNTMKLTVLTLQAYTLQYIFSLPITATGNPVQYI